MNKRKKRSHAKVLAKIERTVVRIFGTIQDTIQYLPSEIISLVLMINKSVHVLFLSFHFFLTFYFFLKKNSF